MTHDDRDYGSVQDVFNYVVKDAGPEGSKLADSLPEVIRIVTTEAPYLQPDPATAMEAAIAAEIRGYRSSLSGKAQALFDQVVDAINDATLWGDMDPVLDLALRTGDSDGIDKTLRFWTIDDWLMKLATSARNVAKAAAADEELRGTVNRIISTMSARGARVVGDLAA